MAVSTVTAPWPSLWSKLPPERRDELEGGAQLHAEPAGEVGLGQQGQAPSIQLVIKEHLKKATCYKNLSNSNLELPIISSVADRV